MVVVLKKDPNEKQLNDLIVWLESLNIEIHRSEGKNRTLLGLVGDTSILDIDLLKASDVVESVKRIEEPYKNANRISHPENTIIKVGNAVFGDGSCPIIAGPCSVESEEQIVETARAIKKSGAKLLRGGAFKPRSSPYSFQGLREEGIKLLLAAKQETGLPIVTELMDLSHINLFDEIDVIQIGARNMQNFELLKEVGKIDKPILLKRGPASTLQEWLMSAEYILAGGNQNVILCERGIRTFETSTRNTLDLSAIPMMKGYTHLPIIVDPSHASGISRLVKPMSLAAVACGADGLMIEVHNDPAHARCDGPQALTPQMFDDVAKCVEAILPFSFKKS